MSGFTVRVLAVVVGLLLIVGIAVGGYLGGWWLRTDTNRREVELRNEGTGTQTAWHDEAIELLSEIEKLPEGSSAAAHNQELGCQLIARLTDTYRDDIIVRLEGQYCG